MEKNRNEEINLLKFIAIVCVILIHDKLPGNIGMVVRGMATMAVPVFFMISGYYSYDLSGRAIGNKVKRTFLMVLLANTLYFIWDICVEILFGKPIQTWFRANCSVKRVIVWIMTNESPFRGHLWFLGALLYAYLFLYFVIKREENREICGYVRKKKDEKLLIFAFILLWGNILGGEVLTQCGIDIQIPYIRNWLFCGVPCLLLGYCIHGYVLKKKEKILSLNWSVVLIVAVLANIVEILLVKPCELYTTTVLVAVASFLFALKFEGKNESKAFVFLGNLADRYGLWIYILQIMVIKSLHWLEKEAGMEKYVIIQWFSPFISLIITCFFSSLLVWLFDLWKKRKYPIYGYLSSRKL